MTWQYLGVSMGMGKPEPSLARKRPIQARPDKTLAWPKAQTFLKGRAWVYLNLAWDPNLSIYNIYLYALYTTY